MIQFKSISKYFKNDFWKNPCCALDKASFQVEKGQLAGFLGHNGAGKTTSMKILMGFIRPTDGEIIYGKELGSNFKDVVTNIGFVPERPFFYQDLTAEQFVRYMGELSDVPGPLLNLRIRRWSEELEIDHAMDRKIREFSKGMLQRLGFMASLIHDPEFLVLDEPLAGMDPIGRNKMKEILKNLNNEGKTIFFSSHIVSDVEEICKKLIVLEQGRVVYDGKIEELVNRHIRPLYHVKTRLPDGGVNDFAVEESEKDRTIRDLLERNEEIVSITRDRPTLEQIIYKTRE